MTLFAYSASLLWLIILLNLSIQSFSREKINKKVLRPQIAAKHSQHILKNERRQSMKQKFSLIHKMKSQSSVNQKKRQNGKSIKRKILKSKIHKDHNRKNRFEKKEQLFKHVANKRTMYKIKRKKSQRNRRKYKKLIKINRRLKMEKRVQSRLSLKNKRLKHKNLKSVASSNETAVADKIQSLSRSLNSSIDKEYISKSGKTEASPNETAVVDKILSSIRSFASYIGKKNNRNSFKSESSPVVTAEGSQKSTMFNILKEAKHLFKSLLDKELSMKENTWKYLKTVADPDETKLFEELLKTLKWKQELSREKEYLTKDWKTVASHNETRVLEHVQYLKSLLNSSNYKEAAFARAKIKDRIRSLIPASASMNEHIKKFYKPAEKTDFDKFISNNKHMLDHNYWKRHFKGFLLYFNDGVREARENIRKHGGNPDKIKSKDICSRLLDRKCYQQGKKVCTEKDSSGECQKWYQIPFRYDKSGKLELWIDKVWDRKPETKYELERERYEEIKAKSRDTCTIQYNSFAGYKEKMCVPVYKILQQHPEFAKKIEDIFPNANAQNYISDAESVVNEIIAMADNPDCELIARLFPFLKPYFGQFTQYCD